MCNCAYAQILGANAAEIGRGIDILDTDAGQGVYVGRITTSFILVYFLQVLNFP